MIRPNAEFWELLIQKLSLKFEHTSVEFGDEFVMLNYFTVQVKIELS